MSLTKVSEEKLATMPTSLRDELVQYFENKKQVEEKAIRDYSFKYTFSGDEQDKSICLAASGKVKAYEEFLRMFK